MRIKRAALWSREPLVWLFAAVMLVGCSPRTSDEHLASAEEYLAAGNDDAAIIELKNAIKNDGGRIAARYQLAELSFAASDYLSAENQFKRVLALLEAGDQRAVAMTEADDLNAAALQDRLWLIGIRQARAAAVLSDLSDLGQRGELSPARRALLGLARLALDDAELAAREFTQALGEEEALPYAHFGQARLAWANGQLEESLARLQRAIELEDRDPELLLTLGELQLARNELQSARAAFQAARDLPGQDLAARMGLARVLLFERRLAEARSELDAVLTQAPEFGPAVYLQALVAYESDDLRTAELALRQVQSLQPNYAPARYLLGAVQFRQNNLVQAQSNLASYLTVEPGNGSARKLLGAVRMQQQDYPGVIDALEPLANGSEDAQTLAMLGTAYARVNRLNRASEILDRAVALAPDVEQLRNQLAVTLLAAGDNTAAIGQLESAIALREEMALSDYLLVLAKLRQNDGAGALANAEALRDKSPNDPMGENLIGAVKFSTGDRQAARDAFERALALDASYEPAVLNLVRLEMEEGNPAAARDHLAKLLANDSDNERALLRLAELELARSNEDALTSAERDQARSEAHELLARATRLHSNSLAPALAQARLGLLDNKIDLADVASARALALAPSNPSALSLRAETLLASGQLVPAREPIEQLARQLAKRDRADPAVANQLLALAGYEERAGLTQQARATFEAVANSGGVMAQTANLALLRLDLRDGELKRARTRVRGADANTRATPAFRLLSADLLNAEGDVQAARRAFETLLAEGQRDALFRLIGLNAADGVNGQADSNRLLQNWLRQHPDDLGAQVALATAALTAGDYSSSRAKFEEVLSVDPDNVVVLNNLAWLYQQTGDQRAREMASRAYELAPGSADVADTYGWILVQEGSLASGRKILGKALELAPGNPSIAYHAAVVFARTGRTEQAIVALQRTGNAKFPEAREALALLQELRPVGEGVHVGEPVNDVEGEAKLEAELVE